MPAETVLFDTDDHLRLEGRLAIPSSMRGGVVLCHPHPQFEGSMSSAMIPALQRGLADAGLVALRFNFRGVGRSEGAYDEGRGETRDALAAIRRVREVTGDLPVSVAGWSFGALVGLNAAVTAPDIPAMVAIAPPISWSATGGLPPEPSPERVRAWRGSLLGICGTQDPFCKPARLQAWVESITDRGEVRVFENEDHFFSGGRDDLVKTVVAFLDGESLA
jgi:alpha/beta superfamily hydrolase